MEKKLGQGLGIYPPVIKSDGTMYICLSYRLFAIDKDGEIKWEYVPNNGGHVFESPAIGSNGNLFVNLSRFGLACLSGEGEELWRTEIKGATTIPPIIGKCDNIYQQSFMQRYPQYVSWIEAFSGEGQKLWTYELNGTIQSTVLAGNNLIYILSNCHTYSKKGWRGKMDVKWELYAIGQT